MPGQRWNPTEMPSLTGTTAVVTGANSGIGWHTALELARHGASVTLAVRTVEKGDRAAARIREAVPAADVGVAHLDLASLASVREFVQAWDGPLGMLVNNAGLMMPRTRQRTRDGFELQFGTNHLGHFALTGGLLPALLTAPAARVVTVSSIAHRWATPDILSANQDAPYDARATYGASKLANLLFAAELQRRAAHLGVSLSSTAAHPGNAATNLLTSEQGLGAVPGVRQLAPLVTPLLMQSSAAGAEPTLYAATVAGPGSYTGPQHLGETRGAVGPARWSDPARNGVLAGKVWALSERLTGVGYAWETRVS